MQKLIGLKIKQLYILLCLGMMSCSQDVIYEHQEKINTPWKYGDQLKFEYEVTDTVPAYDMIITIGHQSSFSYENIYLNTTTIFPDGRSITHPVSFQLADDKGDWTGSCAGDDCSIDIEMSSGAFFKSPGKYQLIFDQYSRDDSLSGIQSIAIIVRKTKK